MTATVSAEEALDSREFFFFFKQFQMLSNGGSVSGCVLKGGGTRGSGHGGLQ